MSDTDDGDDLDDDLGELDDGLDDEYGSIDDDLEEEVSDNLNKPLDLELDDDWDV